MTRDPQDHTLGTINDSSFVQCICCSKALRNWQYKSVLRDGSVNEVFVHPMDGLHFVTYGHYGSSVFDPMGQGTTIDIVVCDDCIVANIEKIHGTGKRDVHEVAMQQNKEYADEQNRMSRTIMGWDDDQQEAGDA